MTSMRCPTPAVLAALLAALLPAVPSARAGAMAQSLTGGSLLASESLSRWSVGVDYERSVRDVRLDGGQTETLTARSWQALVGFDLSSWLTAYGTLGQVEGRMLQDNFGGNDVVWSAGLGANLWEYDLHRPDFLEGRLSLRGVGQYTRTKFDESGNEVKWNELFAALTLNYEVFVVDAEAVDRQPYSLLLYIGPMFSSLDGTHDLGTGSVDFDEDTEYGFGFGGDLFLARNLSIGFHIQEFDALSYRGGLRYHF